MEIEKLRQLQELLELYRDDSFDREEFDKREALRFDVELDIKGRTNEPF